MTKITSETTQEILRLRGEHKTIAQIAETVGHSTSSVWHALHRHGAVKKRKAVNVKDLMTCREVGLSHAEIGDFLGFSRDVVQRALFAAGERGKHPSLQRRAKAPVGAVLRLHRNGKTPMQLAHYFNCTAGNIRYIIKKHGDAA